MNGVYAIIARRGGIQTLKSSYMIQLLCFWYVTILLYLRS